MKKVILMISVLLLASCASKVEEKETKVVDTETNSEVAVNNEEVNTEAENNKNEEVSSEDVTEEVKSEENTSMISELLENNDKPMEKTFQTEMPQNGDLIAIMKTNKGTIKLRLFKDLAPQTVFNFAKHAQDGYYDGLIFHRVIKNFMIQWGDPDGIGTGGVSIYGPKFEDEFSDKLKNIPGSISMANSGPNTNGSQFFINEVNNSHLDNRHSVFGQVIEGMDNVKAIAKVKVGANDMPANEVKIITVEIKEYQDGKLNDYTVGDLETVLDKIAAINEELNAEKEAAKKERMEANKGRVVKAGDEVLVHYTLTLEDGTKIDSSRDRGEEFKFTVKSEPAQVIVGFDEGVLGMKIGDKKSLKIEPKEGYGEYDPKMVEEIDKSILTSQGIEPKVGMELSNGYYNVKVVEVTEDKVKIDNNGPLAGKTLLFDVELIDFAN